jgi:hypothetical protein
MVRLSALAAVAAVALASGAVAPGNGERLYGLVTAQGRAYVAELDPNDLRTLPGRRVQIGVSGAESMPSWSFAPGRRRFAIAIGQRLRILDLPRLRIMGSAKLGTETKQLGVVWVDRVRAVVLQQVGPYLQTAVVDTRRLRIVSRTRIERGVIVDSEPMPAGVAVLLAPNYEIGPARLLLVDAQGSHRDIALTGVRAGTAWLDGHDHVGEQLRPALAVDADRNIAYVLAPSGTLVEVELASAVVRYRSLRGRVAKVVTGESLDAFVLRGRIVVTGHSSSAVTDAGGEPVGTSAPRGLEVIDPSSWDVARLSASATNALPWRDAIVATGGTWSTVTGHAGSGLHVYTIDGRKLRELLPGKRVWPSMVYGDRLYAFVEGEQRATVVDLMSGNVTRRAQPLPWLLLGRSSTIR